MSTTTGDEPVQCTVADHIAVLTLNRPDRRNAINLRMLRMLTDHLIRLDVDRDIRVVLLTGAGQGFCSGLDLKEAAAGTGIGSAGGGHDRFFDNTRNLPTVVLQEMQTPVIGLINGAAAGYGFDLALGCDMRLMAESARFVPGFARLGVVPESGGTWYLPRLVGWARATEIGFLGRAISAADAERIGLVNRVVPDSDLMQIGREWAREVAAKAPLAVQAMKQLFRFGQNEDFATHSHHVMVQMMHLFRTHDFREGVAAQIERRAPQFTGR